jgi:protein-S-isoprenylcysteine O-methyltransferase Ste14
VTPSQPSTVVRMIARRRVALMAIVGVCIVVLHLVLQIRPFSLSEPFGFAGLTSIVIGLLIRSWAAAVVKKNAELATGGPYSSCRHPLYLGSSFMVFGFCLLVGHSWTIAMAPIAMIATYPATIQFEERQLARKFKFAWARYVAEVPAIVPYRVPMSFGRACYKNWLHNREYEAVLTCIVAVAAIEAWHWIR